MATAITLFSDTITTRVEDFKQLYPKLFNFEGYRAIICNVATPLPVDELHHCISLALTYHQRKQAKSIRRNETSNHYRH